ncbi:hypothetical protein Golax_007750 [Gossypium laxum]|uniref:Major facilitator superfamily (MFS) profile domain-containing protein n=1 Tax=Gossypium laxum TaxID=34288 RepID=A0A7J9A7U7_9ROSI|nr:hypothetical protein [Gossypium laxum]
MNLLQRGRGADAEAGFEKLLGGPYVKGAMAELSKSQRGDEADTVKLSELFYGRHRKVVFMGSSLFALQQLSGINAVFYFSSTVFKSAGVPSESANICVGIANLLGSLFALVSMDKLGRKALLIASFSGMVKKKRFGLSFNVWCMLAAYISNPNMVIFSSCLWHL